MEFMQNSLYKAMVLAMTTTMLVACGGSEDGSNGSAGADGAPGVGVPGDQGLPGVDGEDGADGQDYTDTTGGKKPPVSGTMYRLATVPYGAEVTGMFVTEEGDLFFNAQHPSSANMELNSQSGQNKAFDKGTVGVIEGADFSAKDIKFSSVGVPVTDAQKQTIQTAVGNYRILAQNGDPATNGDTEEDAKIGVVYSFDGSTEIIDTDMPDFNAYIAHPDNADQGYLFTNWEQLPGGMSRILLEKSEVGAWSVLDAMMVDFTGVKGTAANCFGSLSPWGTPLTSEEWVVYSKVDTTAESSWNNPEKANNTDDRLGRMWQLSDDASNPYDYGYIVEITDPLAAAPVPVKHYTIGRYEHENSVVMPDRKTVYSSQDDTGGVLFKFVADTAEDLSSGTLYGAKMVQDADSSDPAVTGFDVTWVEMATSNNAQIKTWIESFNNIGTEQYVDGETSYMTVADVVAWADWVRAGRPEGTKYPSIADGGGKQTAEQDMDDRAAFLESRQAARQLGATAEWRKLEGIAINDKRVEEAIEGTDLIGFEEVKEAYMYIGNAETASTMTDGEGDIQLTDRVNKCGTVYRAKILDDYSLNRIEPVITGSTYQSHLMAEARCSVDGLTNPDNVIVLDNGNVLIGEDAGASSRPNNTMWMFDPK